MKKYRFYKENGTWFIDLKWFPFNKANLAMVQGADKLLEKLTTYQYDNLVVHKTEVTLQISTKIFSNSKILIKVVELGTLKGAIYTPVNDIIKHIIIQKNRLWLCPVTLLVFGRYPKTIYYKVIN